MKIILYLFEYDVMTIFYTGKIIKKFFDMKNKIIRQNKTITRYIINRSNKVQYLFSVDLTKQYSTSKFMTTYYNQIKIQNFINNNFRISNSTSRVHYVGM